MEFGITIAPHIERWDLIKQAESLGFDRAWVPDSQMIWPHGDARDGPGSHARQ
jgi:alkanesulfonate monooxygenase SsuD/methylene tetrahydromethanopterin reductase-like flavin-dependent oxidoreductase (luciferase family)